MLIYCPECELKCREDARVCPRCRHKLKEPGASTEPGPSRTKLVIAGVNAVAVLGGLALYFLFSQLSLDPQDAQDLMVGQTSRKYFDAKYRERIRSIAITLNQRPTPAQLDKAVPIARAIVAVEYATFEEACFTLGADLPMVLGSNLTAKDWLMRADYAKTISISDELQAEKKSIERKAVAATLAKKEAERVSRRLTQENTLVRRRMRDVEDAAAQAVSASRTRTRTRRNKSFSGPIVVEPRKEEPISPYEVQVGTAHRAAGDCGRSTTFSDAIRDADRLEQECRGDTAGRCAAAMSNSATIQGVVLVRFNRPMVQVEASGDMTIVGPVKARTEPSSFYLTAYEKSQRHQVSEELRSAKLKVATESSIEKKRNAAFYDNARDARRSHRGRPKSDKMLRLTERLRVAQEASNRFESGITDRVKDRRRMFDNVMVTMYVPAAIIDEAAGASLQTAIRIKAIGTIDAFEFDVFDEDKKFSRAVHRATITACRIVEVK